MEQNAVPGLVNRLLARRADVIALAFADARRRLPAGVPTRLTGNPVRAEIRAVPGQRERLATEARSAFGLETGRRTVVVFGGSQGAVSLNRAAADASILLRDRADLQMLVVAGPTNAPHFEAMAGAAGALLVRTVPFVDRMDLALAVADVAVSRCGAGHVAELTVCEVPSILVPYPHATENHQEANAREVARAGAAEMLLDRDLSGERLAARIDGLMSDEGRSRSMAVAARTWARADAAERLAGLVAEVARR